jgi:hypothetical protein
VGDATGGLKCTTQTDLSPGFKFCHDVPSPWASIDPEFSTRREKPLEFIGYAQQHLEKHAKQKDSS